MRTGLIIFAISAVIIASMVAWLWNMELGDENFFFVMAVFLIAGFCLVASAIVIVVELVAGWACPDIE